MEIGVSLVHLEEVRGPEVALFTALAAADLDHHVLAVVGVLGHEQVAELHVEDDELRLLRRDLLREVRRACRRPALRRASRARR